MKANLSLNIANPEHALRLKDIMISMKELANKGGELELAVYIDGKVQRRFKVGEDVKIMEISCNQLVTI